MLKIVNKAIILRILTNKLSNMNSNYKKKKFKFNNMKNNYQQKLSNFSKSFRQNKQNYKISKLCNNKLLGSKRKFQKVSN